MQNLTLSLFDKEENTAIKTNISLHFFTSNELINEGNKITIQYYFYDTIFGKCIIANTPKGICYLAFCDNDEAEKIQELQNKYAPIFCTLQENKMQKHALNFIDKKEQNIAIQLHVIGTPFQQYVWNALLQIPFGTSTTYGTIANKINKPKASRAVGTAIGSNPIAYIIPCHRVVQSSGKLGGYKWGLARKKHMLLFEQ